MPEKKIRQDSAQQLRVRASGSTDGPRPLFHSIFLQIFLDIGYETILEKHHSSTAKSKRAVFKAVKYF